MVSEVINSNFDKLNNLVKISKGKKYIEQISGKNRYISIEDLHGGNGPKFTDDKGISCSKKDVLIAWDGANAGKVGTDMEGVIGSTLAKMVIIDSRIDSSYLYWYLEANSDLIKSQRTGATIPHVNGTALKNMAIRIMPLPAQQRIAEILYKADALRKKDQQLLKHYDDLAQSLFIDMFGDLSKGSVRWNFTRLSDLCEKITDGTHQSPKFTSKGIPFLFVSNIKDNKIDYRTEKYISEEDFEILNKRTPIEVGNILITSVGSYGNPAIIETETKFAFQRHIAFLKPNRRRVNYVFLYSALKGDFVKRQIDKKVIGVAQKTLNLASLKELMIVCPPISLQNAFAKQIQNIERQKEKVKAQIQESEHLFQALLQQAFNGGLN